MKNIDKIFKFKIRNREVKLKFIIYLSKSDFLIATPTVVIGSDTHEFNIYVLIFNLLINLEV